MADSHTSDRAGIAGFGQSTPGAGAAAPGWRHLVLPVAGAEPISAFLWHSGRPGPLLAILGGVHGDEPEGVLTADALTRIGDPVECGALIVVPVAHPAAFAADSRCCPAGGNLARAFPGDAQGAPVARVAEVLTREVLARADALIDLHTAGRECDMPLLAGYCETGAGAADAPARQMAMGFGAEFIWRHDQTAPGRTLSVMRARGKPAIYVEAAGGGALHDATLRRYRDGVSGAMAALGMREAQPPHERAPIAVAGPGNLDSDVLQSPCAGFFTADVATGDAVLAGQVIGRVMAPGRDAVEVRALRAGHVMFLRRRAAVAVGTPLFLTAEQDTEVTQ